MKIIRLGLEKISKDVFPEMVNLIEGFNELRKDPVRIALAVEGDAIAGMVIYEPGNIIHLHVSGNNRRIGVGRYLLRFLNAELGDTLTAKVLKTDNVALCFFLACGWEITGSVVALGDDHNYFRLKQQTTHSTVLPVSEATERYINATPIFVTTAEGVY